MTQIKEFLRRGLFTVIVLCSAAACSNNDENEDTNYIGWHTMGYA